MFVVFAGYNYKHIPQTLIIHLILHACKAKRLLFPKKFDFENLSKGIFLRKFTKYTCYTV